MEKYQEYLIAVCGKLQSIMDMEGAAIKKTAEKIIDAYQRGGFLFLFGTGHSHMLAEELFYRAGGLVKVKPILCDSLMLHKSASQSTMNERAVGYGEQLAAQYRISSNDVLIIASNSGCNTVAVELALEAKKRGAIVTALTSMAHSSAVRSRHESGKRLFEICDLVLDNYSDLGDACLLVNGRKVAPVSTVTGAAILQAVVAQTASLAAEREMDLEVYTSSNVEGGDKINAGFIEKYSGEIVSL